MAVCELMSALATTNCTIKAIIAANDSRTENENPYALDHEPDPATGAIYPGRQCWPRITKFKTFTRAATAPPAQKVDILHKKFSLNGALCAKPQQVDSMAQQTASEARLEEVASGELNEDVTQSADGVATSRELKKPIRSWTIRAVSLISARWRGH